MIDGPTCTVGATFAGSEGVVGSTPIRSTEKQTVWPRYSYEIQTFCRNRTGRHRTKEGVVVWDSTRRFRASEAQQGYG